MEPNPPHHQHFSLTSAAQPQISQSSTSNHHYYTSNYNYYSFNSNVPNQLQYCFGNFPSSTCMVVGPDHPSSISKMARVCRRMARQRRPLCRISAEARRRSSLTVASNSHVQMQQQLINNHAFRRDVFNFITPDNKRLRVLVKKALKNSDVGALGRIVLPKRAAEENLPSLVEKEGIQLVVREVSSGQRSWAFKYKFWSNNNSRMYVLENTGEFVRQKKLGMGDSFTLYEDESKNLYVSVTKGAESVAGMEGDDGKAYPFGEEEEHEASMALVIDQVLACSHDGTAPVTYPIPIGDGAQPISCTEEEASCNWSATTVDSVVVAGQDTAFDDCYGFLDTLPDANHYNFSP